MASPISQLVEWLNSYQPAMLASYPTVLALLAEEQASGRLQIHPTTLWSGGECLTSAMRELIEGVFCYPVIDEYGASECLSMGFGCREGWLHVNADWVILEPVDKNRQPVKPGEASFSVLLTNLANRIQPIIRYDLGDSVVVKPDRCACGSLLPAMQVMGRRDDVLSLRGESGASVRLPPMAISTVVEEAAGVHRFQIVQNGPESLSVRFDIGDYGDRAAIEQRSCAALHCYLVSQGLSNVRITIDKQGPAPDALSGKFRTVCRSV